MKVWACFALLGAVGMGISLRFARGARWPTRLPGVGIALWLGLCLWGLGGCRAAETPVLRVGTSGDYAPFSIQGRGFDVDVAQLLARDLGYRIEWVPFVWSELGDAVREGRFDVAMSGVTWQPRRAALGWMTRALAAGGPCWLEREGAAGAEEAVETAVRVESPVRLRGRVGVNGGGFLERWSRARLDPGAVLRTAEDNLALPGLLASGQIDVLVTDRFELPSFRDALQAGGVNPAPRASCTPPRYRKVYWVAPARAAELGPALDAWIARAEPELAEARERWWGAADPREPLDHLVDLLARRLAFMPAVAAVKRERGLEIEDGAQEERVLASADRAAREGGLEPDSLRALFRVQIELAKAVQRRTVAGVASAAPPPGSPLDLERELRPALARLSERIASALADQVPLGSSRLRPALDALLGELLEPAERDALERALRGLRREGGEAQERDAA